MSTQTGHAERRTLHLPDKPLQRVYTWLRGSATGLLTLALLVGTGAGVGAVVFRYLILGFTVLFTGHRDYSAAGHAPNPFFPFLGLWFVVVAPVVGGLLYGPLIERFAREARGHGVPEVMLAVAERGGRIGPQVAVIKSLASALCIGSGGSVGREGPIVQIGAALGSSLGQWLRVPDARLRLLVACGAAGGISATFNAPIAGVFFALELILRDFETASFGVIVDLELTRDQPRARQRVMDVQWPPSSLVIAVRRHGEVFAPNGQTELRKGDRLTVLVPAEHAETLTDVVHATQHCSPRA